MISTINEVITQTQKYIYFFHNWIDKLFSVENKVPRTLLRKVGRLLYRWVIGSVISHLLLCSKTAILVWHSFQVFNKLKQVQLPMIQHLEIPGPGWLRTFINIHYIAKCIRWECFPRIFDHSSRSTFERSHTDVEQEGLALSLCSNSSQRCSVTLGTLKHSEFFSLELRGQAQLLKNNPTL